MNNPSMMALIAGSIPASQPQSWHPMISAPTRRETSPATGSINGLRPQSKFLAVRAGQAFCTTLVPTDAIITTQLSYLKKQTSKFMRTKAVVYLTQLAGPAFVAIFIQVSSVQAAVLLSEDFDYTVGVDISGQNGGSGWNGAWQRSSGEGYANQVRNFTVFGAPNRSYPNLVTDSGSYLNLYGLGFNEAVRTVDAGGVFSAFSSGGVVGNTGTLWGSFLAINDSSSAHPGAFFFRDGATTNYINVTGSGTNSLVLFKVDYTSLSSSTLTIWHNPDLTTWTPSATPNSTTLGDYSFNQLGFGLQPNDESRFDKLVIGEQAIDVVPYTISAIPEPSNNAVLGLGLVSMACWVRRRNKKA